MLPVKLTGAFLLMGPGGVPNAEQVFSVAMIATTWSCSVILLRMTMPKQLMPSGALSVLDS